MRRFHRCLQPEGTGTTGAFRASEALRARVRFQHLNLVSIPYPLRPTFDVIFLRNTLIYFSEATRQRVVSEVVKHLAPWGILVIGHSESLIGLRLGLRSIGNSAYRKGE